ncbi:unnamed protein product [Camellia sinensis]
MEVNNMGLLGTAGGGGGGGSSGGSTNGGSMSTVSMDNNLILTSEESSSYPHPDESELQLGLGLSLCGGGGALKSKSSSLTPNPTPRWGQYARILTAQDFPSMMPSNPSSSSSNSPSPSPSLSSSSSSSSSMTKANFSAGTKRSADSVAPSPPNGGVSRQVVGWPPLRAHRINSMVNQTKLPATEEFQSTVEKTKSKNGVVDMTNSGIHENKNNVKEKRQLKTSLFVKVNMDGIPIGRKVDLSAHNCYETLAQTLEDMFCRPTSVRGPSMEAHNIRTEATGPPSKLLDGSSEFVLTYEDREGDWMLAGDVPWGMFLSSVKRLRIMRTSEANGLGTRLQERNGRLK